MAADQRGGLMRMPEGIESRILSLQSCRAQTVNEIVSYIQAAEVLLPAEEWEGTKKDFAINFALQLAKDIEQRFLGGEFIPQTRGSGKISDWVKCPVCGRSEMVKTTDSTGKSLIHCTYLRCGSNGGEDFSEVPANNASELEAVTLLKQGITSVEYQRTEREKIYIRIVLEGHVLQVAQQNKHLQKLVPQP